MCAVHVYVHGPGFFYLVCAPIGQTGDDLSSPGGAGSGEACGLCLCLVPVAGHGCCCCSSIRTSPYSVIMSWPFLLCTYRYHTGTCVPTVRSRYRQLNKVEDPRLADA